MDANLLAKIRALLAKAENTPYQAEAEAFNEKATELIAKYGIDTALLATQNKRRDTITSAVIVMNNPYSYEKATLLHVIADSLRCQALAHHATASTVNKVTLVGYESDLERAMLLYTSLLLQATTTLTRARPAGNDGYFTTSVVAFRKSWWAGFNTAVREQLRAAEQRAAQQATPTSGVSTELVLRDRTREVKDAFRDMFPNTRTGRALRSSSTTGYHNGRAAGERADLGAPRVGGTRWALPNN